MKKIFKLFGIIAFATIIGFSITACTDDSQGGTIIQIPPDLQVPPASKGPANPESFDDITATELVAKIKVGWNLGNTLDAGFPTWLNNPTPTIPQLETAWGNPVTTEAMITAIKDAGFNAIRIPISWTKCADANNNYKIRNDWMDRVTEIVNYAVANDMYILLNTHHDEDVFKFTSDKRVNSINAFINIWWQIACNFKNYNEKLIFEGLNEPRTIGSSAEWNGGTGDERAILDEHYKYFVETVRASGGNNNKRFLMINTYGASGLAVAMSGLTIPADTVQNKIIVSYHAYEPYNFALNEENGSVKTWSQSNSSDTSPITSRIDQAYNTFVSNGIPVIIGEFGALNKDNESTRAAWVKYYVEEAKKKSIKCFWWDDGGNFKLYDRNNNTFYFPQIKDGLIQGAGN